jgi:hypothetical protein
VGKRKTNLLLLFEEAEYLSWRIARENAGPNERKKVMDFIQTRALQPPGPCIYDDRLPDCAGLLGQ